LNKICLFASSLVLFACGGSAPPPAAPAAGAAPAETPASSAAASGTFAAQAQAGQELYGKNCAGCHGAHGNDGKAPPVVGLDKGALPLDPPPGAKFRKSQFKTVGDVADFVVKTMPPKAPGSLSADEYYAILAFDLQANGIDLGDKKLDGALAATLEIPRK
jgi:mono/diheme cytochrome c family protein